MAQRRSSVLRWCRTAVADETARCIVSGKVPTEPVVSRKTGHVFERSLIMKHLDQTHACPVTGEPLAEEDLLTVQSNPSVKPRPESATSFPDMVRHFQDEWDALMLETHELKRSLDTSRQQLSQLFYQYDAAVRVIARLTRERDEARAMLAQARTQPAMEMEDGDQAGAAGGELSEEGLLARTVERMESKAAELSGPRKKRKVPTTLTAQETMAEWSEKASHNLHTADRPGVTCLDLHKKHPNLVLTGGQDKKAVLFDREAGSVRTTLEGHSKGLVSVHFHPDDPRFCVTTSKDGNAVLWGSNDDALTAYSARSTVQPHHQEIRAASLHPLGDVLATASAGSHAGWCLSDLTAGRVVVSMADDSATEALRTLEFHPDGLILGTALGSQVRLWDLRSRSDPHAMDDPDSAHIESMAFSESGYQVVTGGSDGMVKLWDLRKRAVVHSWSVAQAAGGRRKRGADHSVRAVTIDHSGRYVAAATSNIAMGYLTKNKERGHHIVDVASFDDHSAPVTGLRFGPDASFLLSTSMDRSLKLFQ